MQDVQEDSHESVDAQLISYNIWSSIYSKWSLVQCFLFIDETMAAILLCQRVKFFSYNNINVSNVKFWTMVLLFGHNLTASFE